MDVMTCGGQRRRQMAPDEPPASSHEHVHGKHFAKIVRMSTTSWRDALKNAAASGTAASVVSTLVVTSCGQREIGDLARPINGPSQWLWGRHAAYVRGPSVRHTVVGYAIHHTMSLFWAAFFERFRPRGNEPTATVVAAAATATMAYIADFKVVPPRLSPGFETGLSRRCVIAAYVAFAGALAATALSTARR